MFFFTIKQVIGADFVWYVQSNFTLPEPIIITSEAYLVTLFACCFSNLYAIFQCKFLVVFFPCMHTWLASCISGTSVSTLSFVRDYAESVRQKTEALGLNVSIVQLSLTVSLTAAMENAAQRGLLYTVIITAQHEAHRSITLTILRGRNPQGAPTSTFRFLRFLRFLAPLFCRYWTRGL